MIHCKTRRTNSVVRWIWLITLETRGYGDPVKHNVSVLDTTGGLWPYELKPKGPRRCGTVWTPYRSFRLSIVTETSFSWFLSTGFLLYSTSTRCSTTFGNVYTMNSLHLLQTILLSTDPFDPSDPTSVTSKVDSNRFFRWLCKQKFSGVDGVESEPLLLRYYLTFTSSERW